MLSSICLTYALIIQTQNKSLLLIVCVILTIGSVHEVCIVRLLRRCIAGVRVIATLVMLCHNGITL